MATDVNIPPLPAGFSLDQGAPPLPAGFTLDQGQPQGLTWGQVPLEAAKNIPSSAFEFGKGIYQTIAHPVKTTSSLADLFTGTVQNLLPEQWQAASAEEKRQLASNVGEFFKNRYGGLENVKQTMAKDPIGFLADASVILSGGGSLASKIPGLTKAGNIASTAGRAVNPLTIAGKVLTPAAKISGTAASNLIGGLGTHTGAESISQAAKAGFRGRKAAEAFQQNLRGNVPITNVLEEARSGLNTIKQAKNAQYRSGMMDISADKSILSLKGIDKAVKNARNSISFKGQVKDPNAAKYISEIQDEVTRWKKMNPKAFHTPEGLDALKQRVSSIAEKIPFEQSNSRRVVGDIVNSIKSEITNQAPTYSKVMKGYSQATNQIKELEKSLVGTSKTSPDTALRKLQSIMRNNVNTNYGRRAELANILEQQGGREIMPALAGQSLSSWTPRSLGNLQMGGTLGAAAIMQNPAIAALLIPQSPRLMGEAAYYAGKAAKPISKLGFTQPYVLPSYQAGRTGLLGD